MWRTTIERTHPKLSVGTKCRLLSISRSSVDERANRIIAVVKARVKHPFQVIKRQFGHVKTRYRGLAKNATRRSTLFALGNLLLVRRRLMA